MTLRTCRNWTHHQKHRLDLTQIWAMTSGDKCSSYGRRCFFPLRVERLQPLSAVGWGACYPVSVMHSASTAQKHPALRLTPWLQHARYTCFSVTFPWWLWLQMCSLLWEVHLKKDPFSTHLACAHCNQPRWGGHQLLSQKEGARDFLDNGVSDVIREFKANEQINLHFNWENFSNE